MNNVGIDYFLKQVQTLPSDLRLAILSVDYLGNLRKIQKTRNLHIDQGSAMENSTFRLMLGEIETPDFEKGLIESMHLSPGQAAEIARDIDQEVLDPIRQEFQRIQQEENDEEYIEESTESGGPKTPAKILQFSENEDHSTLSAEEILSGIENPHPVISSVHGTVLPEKMRPSDTASGLATLPRPSTVSIENTPSTSSSQTDAATSAPLVSITNSILSMKTEAGSTLQESTPASVLAPTSQVVSNQKPRLSTADILANAAKQFPASTDSAAKTIQQQPKAPPAPQTPTQQVSANLQNNLTATTVSKPQNLTQITTSIDPYREKAI